MSALTERVRQYVRDYDVRELARMLAEAEDRYDKWKGESAKTRRALEAKLAEAERERDGWKERCVGAGRAATDPAGTPWSERYAALREAARGHECGDLDACPGPECRLAKAMEEK